MRAAGRAGGLVVGRGLRVATSGWQHGAVAGHGDSNVGETPVTGGPTAPAKGQV